MVERQEDLGERYKPRRRRTGLLAPFNNCRVSVELNEGEYSGTAFYERDATLGNVLKVSLDLGHIQGTPEIVICEEQWTGRIILDFHHGCECRFVPESIS